MTRRALVYCAGGGIGDSLVASVVARALHARFDAVDALTLPSHRDLLERVVPFDHVLVDNGGDRDELAAKVRERSYEACVVTWATSRTARVAQIAGIPVRVGQARRLYSHRFTNQVIVRSERGDVTSHWSDVLLDYARAIGCDTADRRPQLALRAEDEREADAFLERHRLEQGGFVVLHPTCAVAPRRPLWPMGGWIRVAHALREREGMPLVISGGPADGSVLQPLIDATGAISVVGTLSIGGLAAMLARARAMIVMHSGPMHIAAAVGTPTVGIFPLQCDFPDRWRPIGPHVSLVRSSYRCRAGERIETCPDYACIANLDVMRVLAAYDDAIGR